MIFSSQFLYFTYLCCIITFARNFGSMLTNRSNSQNFSAILISAMFLTRPGLSSVLHKKICSSIYFRQLPTKLRTSIIKHFLIFFEKILPYVTALPSWNPLCIPDLPGTHRDLPFSASPVLELVECHYCQTHLPLIIYLQGIYVYILLEIVCVFQHFCNPFDHIFLLYIILPTLKLLL